MDSVTRQDPSKTLTTFINYADFHVDIAKSKVPLSSLPEIASNDASSSLRKEFTPLLNHYLPYTKDISTVGK